MVKDLVRFLTDSRMSSGALMPARLLPEQVLDIHRHFAKRLEPFAGLQVEMRNGCHQALQVGMAGPAEYRLDRTRFHDLAMIDDHHFVRDIRHHAEIVRDQQHRHVELGLKVAQQLQDLRLDGDVERRRRLVGDQQGGAADQRHGDHRALTQSARKFEGIHVIGAPGVGEADKAEHVLGARLSLCAEPWAYGSAGLR